jgi:hypothetical protein
MRTKKQIDISDEICNLFNFSVYGFNNIGLPESTQNIQFRMQTRDRGVDSEPQSYCELNMNKLMANNSEEAKLFVKDMSDTFGEILAFKNMDTLD